MIARWTAVGYETAGYETAWYETARYRGGPADDFDDQDRFDNKDRFVDEDRLVDEEDDGGEWDDWRLGPRWLFDDCADSCTALNLGTCCKYRAAPIVRRAVRIADSADRTLRRSGHGECSTMAAELARLRPSVPGLLAQVHAVLPTANATTVAQLLCPVGRLAVALAQVCAAGCPWACDHPAEPDRRAEFDPLRVLLDESLTALRAALTRPRPPR